MVEIKKNLSVGIRGSVEELEKILSAGTAKYIHEIFVGAPPEIGNTGRFNTYPTSLTELQKIIKLAHKHKIKTDVVLNAVCLGKLKDEKAYKKKIAQFVQDLELIKADWITIAHSDLLKTFSSVRKKIKIKLSVYARVDSPLLAEEFGKMGVDRIALPQNINRNLNLIKRIIDFSQIPTEIFVNSKCINSGNCPHSISHKLFKAHQSPVNPSQWGEVCDPYLKWCKARRKLNKIDKVFTPTIRPEDLKIYESAGVKLFKLATRTDTPERVIELVKAYGKRSFNGPFGDLWTVDKDLKTPSNKLFDGLLEKVLHLPEEEQKEIYRENFIE